LLIRDGNSRKLRQITWKRNRQTGPLKGVYAPSAFLGIELVRLRRRRLYELSYLDGI